MNDNEFIYKNFCFSYKYYAAMLNNNTAVSITSIRKTTNKPVYSIEFPSIINNLYIVHISCNILQNIFNFNRNDIKYVIYSSFLSDCCYDSIKFIFPMFKIANINGQLYQRDNNKWKVI